MKKELLILKRKKAKELNKIGWSNRKIARYLVVNKNSIGKWLKIDETEIEVDQRGWKKGTPRKYTIDAKERIKKIRKDLEKENSYFIGSTVVKANYEKQTCKTVSLSFVDRVLKEAGLTKTNRKKEKGRSKYMSKRSFVPNELSEIYIKQVRQNHDEY